MKKFIALALALCMASMMSVCSFAAEVNTDGGSGSPPVYLSFGSHCHFEVRDRAGNSIDPAPFLGIRNAVGTYGTDWRAEVQKKFGLSAHTMAYLDKYPYAADLYMKLGKQ